MSLTLARLACFIAALLECLRSWRTRPGWHHKTVNLGIVIVDSIVILLVVPVSLIEVAVLAQRHAIGLLHLVPMPRALEAIIGFLLLDLSIYVQHLLFHRLPWLWRLHRVHHTDPSLDVTSGVRFHPLEIVISVIIKAFAIMAFGVAPMAVLIFKIVLNVSSVFKHANLRLPAMLEHTLRLCVVTPNMYRVHHSAVHGELNHNYSFNFSWWERLFHTYLQSSTLPGTDMSIGIPGEVGANPGFITLLWLPFKHQ